MTDDRRRGVTRGYVGGLIFAAVIVSFALLLAGWGGISLLLSRGPISTPDTGLGVAALLIVVCLAALAWSLWLQSLVLLRGKRSPSWGHVLGVAVGSYLLWCMGGVLFGLLIEDTWLSPYPTLLALAWAIGSLVCWAVLARRVYTERPTPQWPWEKRGDDQGPDWANTDQNPWTRFRADGHDGYGDSGGSEDRPDGDTDGDWWPPNDGAHGR